MAVFSCVIASDREEYAAGKASEPTLVAAALKLPTAVTTSATVGDAPSTPANKLTDVSKFVISAAVAAITPTPSLVITRLLLASTLSSIAPSWAASTSFTNFTTGELSI